ncbi:MAG: molecular chaperone HtpG, partial [Clostridia bacterium]
MAKKQFKAESKRLLDLMINSIYTHREIFLRELISNASDATDKRYYNAMSEGAGGLNRDDLAIEIALNKDTRTITINDHGCGMTASEMEDNLGIIAKSGSLSFKQENEKMDDVDIIGQFGVGFYAAFMVSANVKVFSRAAGEDLANCWESNGADGYTISKCEREEVGSCVILKLKENTEDENFDEFLDEYRISELITKYSDYIRYPIRMDMTKSRLKEGSEDEYESYTENTTINSMIPIWKKAKNEVTDEDYNTFYSEKFHDASAPARRIHTSTEGTVSYTSLLFIPSRAPYDYYTRDFEKGLALYANGVMIMEKCEALLPDYFSFVRGLVDSQDLSLNISRELLQHDRQLRVIAASIEKKVRAELMDMLENEREEYEKFYANFGIQLKYGTYANFGQDKDKLRDLLMFNSSNDEKLTTLKEYVTRMKDGQEHIYYAAGDSIGKLKNLPQSELVRSRGFEILYLTDDVDEFALRILNDCDGKTFKSVTDGDSCLETEDEKKEIEAKSEENRAVLDAIKEALGDKVGSVKLSPRLTTCPVCLTTEGGISTSMEKVLNAMPNAEKIHAQRVLEINASHPVFEAL